MGGGRCPSGYTDEGRSKSIFRELYLSVLAQGAPEFSGSVGKYRWGVLGRPRRVPDRVGTAGLSKRRSTSVFRTLPESPRWCSCHRALLESDWSGSPVAVRSRNRRKVEPGVAPHRAALPPRRRSANTVPRRCWVPDDPFHAR